MELLKTPEPEPHTTFQQPPKPYSNGVLKLHAPPPHHHHHPIVVTYKECLKNHAASLGGHALDGCGEFMPSPTTSNNNPPSPTSLKCAACGCHRNFHRRDPDHHHDNHPPLLLLPPPPSVEFRPHHRHHPSPPPIQSPDNSPSPPPISSAYYPNSVRHLALDLHNSVAAAATAAATGVTYMYNSNANGITGNGRKRFRTRFSQGQKERMQELAEKLGWKMSKKDEDMINGVCSEIGVEKGVFKVWMHNNKSNRTHPVTMMMMTTAAAAVHLNGVTSYDHDHDESKQNIVNVGDVGVGNNGSSCSS